MLFTTEPFGKPITEPAGCWSRAFGRTLAFRSDVREEASPVPAPIARQNLSRSVRRSVIEVAERLAKNAFDGFGQKGLAIKDAHYDRYGWRIQARPYLRSRPWRIEIRPWSAFPTLRSNQVYF